MRWAAIAFAALPATAQEVMLTEHGPHAQPYATVTLLNSISDTAGWHDFHLDTSEGPVTVRVLVTPNGIWTANGCQPGCEDELHISDWPEGVTPVPLYVVVPEQSAGEINLYRFVGM